MNDRVIPFFDEHEIPPGRVLTDRGTESIAATPSTTSTSSTWQIEDIDHTRTKLARSPQTNGNFQ